MLDVDARVQSVIFHVEEHPAHPGFHQCVTFNFFPTPTHERVYNMFTLCAVYLFPLIAIIVSYGLVLLILYRKDRRDSGTCLFHCLSQQFRVGIDGGG